MEAADRSRISAATAGCSDPSRIKTAKAAMQAETDLAILHWPMRKRVTIGMAGLGSLHADARSGPFGK
jgi:hypothetical protein